MERDDDKLLIKIGQNFEAHATGKLAIAVVFIVFCVSAYSFYLS